MGPFPQLNAMASNKVLVEIFLIRYSWFTKHSAVTIPFIKVNKGQEANKGLFNLVYGENIPSILLLYSFCEHFTDLSAGGEAN